MTTKKRVQCDCCCYNCCGYLLESKTWFKAILIVVCVLIPIAVLILGIFGACVCAVTTPPFSTHHQPEFPGTNSPSGDGTEESLFHFLGCDRLEDTYFILLIYGAISVSCGLLCWIMYCHRGDHCCDCCYRCDDPYYDVGDPRHSMYYYHPITPGPGHNRMSLPPEGDEDT